MSSTLFTLSAFVSVMVYISIANIYLCVSQFAACPYVSFDLLEKIAYSLLASILLLVNYLIINSDRVRNINNLYLNYVFVFVTILLSITPVINITTFVFNFIYTSVLLKPLFTKINLLFCVYLEFAEDYS